MSGTIIVVKAARCHFLDLPAKQQVTGNPCLESKAAKKPNQIDPCSIWLTSFHLADDTEGKVPNHHSSGGFQRSFRPTAVMILQLQRTYKVHII